MEQIVQQRNALFASSRCIKTLSTVIPVPTVKVQTLLKPFFMPSSHACFYYLLSLFLMHFLNCRSMCNVRETSTGHKVLQAKQCIVHTSVSLVERSIVFLGLIGLGIICGCYQRKCLWNLLNPVLYSTQSAYDSVFLFWPCNVMRNVISSYCATSRSDLLHLNL